MSYVAADRNSVLNGAAPHFAQTHPVASAWLVLSLLFTVSHLLGHSPARDLDDLLRMHQIRTHLQGGAWFDNTLPGIHQPERFVSHWPHLVDLPYAIPAAFLAPLLGTEGALSLSAFVMPLVLLAPTVFFLLHRIIASLGFERTGIVLVFTLVTAYPALFEFAPGRVDYHNIQIVLLLAATVLTMSWGRRAAALAGAVTAVAFAMSAEFALFFATLMAVRVISFVAAAEGAEDELSAFGIALTATAAVLLPIVVAPGNYDHVVCDSYSAPHVFGLAFAGVTFVVAGQLLRSWRSWVVRGLLLGTVSAVGLLALMLLFPECRAGPYGDVSTYLLENWLSRIGQEKNLFQRSDIATR